MGLLVEVELERLGEFLFRVSRRGVFFTEADEVLSNVAGGVDAERVVPLVRGGVTNLKRMPRAKNPSGKFELLCGLFGGHKVIWFWLNRRGDSGQI